MSWISDEERRARAREEYAYRRGYDQAWFFVLCILDKFGKDLGIKRIKNLKPYIKEWRGRGIYQKKFQREEPPGSSQYNFDRPKKVKDRKYF